MPRDPACKISYQLISSASYSNRHKLQIKWSKRQQQEIPISVLPQSMSYEFSPRLINISMLSIATPTPSESEAYISTVTLFAISEEKAAVRLPALWRGLWKDLAQKNQAR